MAAEAITAEADAFIAAHAGLFDENCDAAGWCATVSGLLWMPVDRMVTRYRAVEQNTGCASIAGETVSVCVRSAGVEAEPYRCRCGGSACQPGSLRTLSTIDSDVSVRHRGDGGAYSFNRWVEVLAPCSPGAAHCLCTATRRLVQSSLPMLTRGP